MTNHNSMSEIKAPLEQAALALVEAFPLTDAQKKELEIAIERIRRDWHSGQFSDDLKGEMYIRAADALGVSIEELTDDEVIQWDASDFFISEYVLPYIDVDRLYANFTAEQRQRMMNNHNRWEYY